jgi:hypothetical protein
VLVWYSIDGVKLGYAYFERSRFSDSTADWATVRLVATGASAARILRPGVRLSRAAPRAAEEMPRAMASVVNCILMEERALVAVASVGLVNDGEAGGEESP